MMKPMRIKKNITKTNKNCINLQGKRNFQGKQCKDEKNNKFTTKYN